MIYILLIIIALLILEKIIDNKQNQTNQNTQISNTNYLNSFSKKEYLLTQNELKFYKILKQITDKLELNLFCQVAMYELINCKNYKDFNRIKSKSIDFVITEKNCKIKCCIELDDNTHKQIKRQERDNVVDSIFKSANVNLLRISVQNFYNLENLEQLIKNNI